MDNHSNDSLNIGNNFFGIGNNNSNCGENKSTNNDNEQQKWILHDRLPSPVTLKEALTRYLDITNPPTQRILSILSEHASNSYESELLKNLSKDSAAYENWKAKYFPNFLEILTEFSSINPPLEFIFTQLPVLKPRHYSISSSSLTQSAFQIDLTVAVIQYYTESGYRHYGVCSNFLNDKPIGGDVFAFIRSAPNFRLPKERKVPIIMVGPGTGIAPFRSFWEHRIKLKELNPSADYGKMTLFFGCRYPSMQLYREEIETAMLNNVIKDYHVAYSRQPNQPKKYVQDIMRLLSRQIYSDLIERKGHIYVCGDVSMAQDVNKTLQFILNENGIHDADMTLLSLKESMRYHEDIFGITLRTAEVTNRNRSDAVRRTFSNS
ncbi:hypothetical protein BLA29_005645 [Euroglyphus maynei]|uniref:nitric-oxide synthase (NADPH) n=1 Tax=Euroglyphus maynei TaxID=6958 RepID=A0A1Y3B1N8_EURMA|nr:hypothetical protein BLA29_005645 [Euroglyphus maynei]